MFERIGKTFRTTAVTPPTNTRKHRGRFSIHERRGASDSHRQSDPVPWNIPEPPPEAGFPLRTFGATRSQRHLTARSVTTARPLSRPAPRFRPD